MHIAEIHIHRHDLPVVNGLNIGATASPGPGMVPEVAQFGALRASFGG